MRHRIARMISAKSFQNTDMDSLAEYLEITDLIDNRLGEFKKKYQKLKTKAIKKLERQHDKQREDEKKVEEEEEVEEEESSEEETKKKKKKDKKKKKRKETSEEEEIDNEEED